MFQIVATDTFVTDFDGLSWNEVAGQGEFKAYPETPEELRLERIKQADAVLVNKVIIDRLLLKQLPRLKYIGVTATGVNNIDLEAARERQIAVANVPGYSTLSVAQTVWAYILDYYTRLPVNSSKEAMDRWHGGSTFSHLADPFFELGGKTLGIVGSGAIGSKVAAIGRAMGMDVLFAVIPGRPAGKGEKVPLDTLLKTSDVVSLHCPLTELTEGLFDLKRLSLMKPSAILINTARGGIVNEEHLARILNAGGLAHAYLDVMTEEPPSESNPLIGCDRVTITPHIAWASVEARKRLITESALNLKAFIEGEIRNRVDLVK